MGLLGLQIIWTNSSTHALKNARTDKKIMKATDDHFMEMLASLIEITTQELSKIERIKFETLITIHLHQRDIFNALVSQCKDTLYSDSTRSIYSVPFFGVCKYPVCSLTSG